MSKKFIDEIKEHDRARKFALNELPHASASQAELILDFALWTRVPFEDGKFIIECTARNPHLAQSDSVYDSISTIYYHEPFKPQFDQDAKLAGYLKKYQKAVTKRREEEERRHREQMAAFSQMVQQAAKNVDEQAKNLSSEQQPKPPSTGQP